MRINWSIDDGEMTLTLTPETDGDKMALKFCDKFEGQIGLRYESSPYDLHYGRDRGPKSARVTLRRQETEPKDREVES
jgi:hypothetical protein